MYFIKGADISWLKYIEDLGGKYYEQGKAKNCLEILNDKGINYIRLRIWNNPGFNYCNKESTLLMAKSLKEYGFKFLLDFHYSDFWADPAHQTKPKAWENLTFEKLKTEVYEYTKDIITSLRAQNTLPDMVQIGNEITWGMLWPEGKLSPDLECDEEWDKFTDLVKAGIDGVIDSIDPDEEVKIMIHIDRGGDNETSVKFFDKLISKNVDFDVIGQSFYPLWHGSLSDLEYNINDLATRYNKEIVVVECAYPFSLKNVESSTNIIINEKQLHKGYDATPEGQANYMRDLMIIVKNVSENKGLGIFYWEPDWILVDNDNSNIISVNNWYNQALFDFQGNSLIALDVISEF